MSAPCDAARLASESGPAVDRQVVLEAHDLAVWFAGSRRGLGGRPAELRAVDGVGLEVRAGETLAIVGESGCGKTTLGRALALLHRPTRGTVRLGGQDLTRLRGQALRLARRPLQMIFQDPYGSLDPRQTVGDIIAEPLVIRGASKQERLRRVAELLGLVGLGEEAGSLLPRQFSGGQRQRIGIARALAAEPKLIICDEPLSALDVSIQAQIVNLLIALQARLGVGYLFISHDLAVVRQIAHRVAVMYLGRIVELASTAELFAAPRHPYTVGLLLAVPALSDAADGAPELLVSGDPPSPAERVAGCAFRPRCWLWARLGKPELCAASAPPAPSAVERASCHFADATLAHLEGEALRRLRIEERQRA